MNFLLDTGSIDFSGFWNSLKNTILSFRVGDLIEVLILAVVFFVTFKFLKGRKAGALIIGIVVCFAIMFISRIFEFNALYSIFSGIIGSGALVIGMIFQPEIREALEKIGSGSITGILNFSDRKKKKELYFNVIENVCSAVRELSAESTGALIVIERTTRLNDIVETGIALNANVNASLLRNLFFNKAPLHDGAVIITDGRIAAAGCFLPLSRRTDIDPDLGTRHRAGIGMTETSDAIVVIVSEETGSISVAVDCTLTRELSVEALHSFLTENILRGYVWEEN